MYQREIPRQNVFKPFITCVKAVALNNEYSLAKSKLMREDALETGELTE